MIKIIFCFNFLIVTSFCGESDVSDMMATAKSFSFQNKDYNMLFVTEVDWYNAVRICQLLGMQLVSFDDKTEAQFVMDHLKNSSFSSSFWTSGHSLGHPEMYKWFSSGVHFFQDDNFWVSNADRHDTNCVYLDHKNNFRFNTDECSRDLRVICESISIYSESVN